jgi:hypothetical protein
MKLLITFIVLSFLFFGMVYIGGCFAFVSFDISSWPPEDRKMLAWMGGFFCLFISAVVTGMMNDPTTKSDK